ncbi:MAG: histidinol-phosphatase HisJ family protein [Clostridia bacterium]|nr:histidinol-phosphatase HisJ family protein [Clostridia bacterium]
MKLYDMHTHTAFSHDSVCPMEEMAEAQLAKGVSGFAATEHCDCLTFSRCDNGNALLASCLAAEQLDKEYGGAIRIFRGIEIGEGFLAPENMRHALSLYDYDIVIGSVHYVHNPNGYSGYCADTDFSVFSHEELMQFLDAYLNNFMLMLKNTPCDVMAHLTYALRYINGKYGRNMDLCVFSDKIDDILRYIIDHGIALEVNTSGIDTAYGDFFPDERILRRYQDFGGTLLTLGSDAHTAERAAVGFRRACALLKQIGFTQYYYFEKRRAISCDL